MAALAADEEEEESMSILPAPPGWVEQVEAEAQYVGVLGSESKFREDRNIQSGVSLGARGYEEQEGGEAYFFDGLYRPVEKQGFGRMGWGQLEGFSFDAEVQAWTEFYNTRPGVDDVTALGTTIGGVFPNTTDSRSTLNGGKPNVDWLTLNAGVATELPGPFNDVYGDFLYREIKGEMSLLKGGTITDPLAVPAVIPGSGPGTVAFDFPGRKDVDYETIGGLVGVRSSLLGIAWRFDASAYRHEIEADTREVNFAATPGGSELESFREDTDILTAHANLVGSRQVNRALFVYGGGQFAWAQSDPDPSQNVQTGISPTVTASVLTRSVISSDVKRLNEAFTTGFVYTPMPKLSMTGDFAFRASQQEGDLFEVRNESTLLTGDTGTVENSSERNRYSIRLRGDAKWKAARRLAFEGHASYKYSEEEVESTRNFGFVVAEPSEIEDYEIIRDRFQAGASGKYRLRGARRVQVGYDFMYDAANTDINALSNQFIVSDYERLQHKVFAKASGRIMKKLRGEVRFQYIFEERDIDAPLVDSLVAISADNGEVEFQGFTIVPTVSYQHDEKLSGYVSLSIGRQQWEIANAGVTPVGFSTTGSSFEYETVTETGTIGVNWLPSERLKTSATYTIYNNNESVENMGHNAAVRGAFVLDEDWDLTGGLRYLGYQPDDNTQDDYSAFVVTLGVNGTF